MTHSAILPDITITAADYDRLSSLAENAAVAAPAVAKFLLDELDRAQIASRPSPAPIVRMGSHVYFRDEDDETVRRMRLVYPDQSDPQQNHLSILTPVGAALIGLSAGQSIRWRDRRGALKKLTVLAVHNAPQASDG